MRIHFIAIGGAAMHNLALALQKKGDIVTGSDDEIFEPSRSRLDKAGILPEAFGWYPEKITGEIDAIILGMHAREDNPELLKAQALGLKIFSYPEFLYEQTKGKKRVVIGGSHGKTTITAMVMHVLKDNQVDFDYMVGSQIDGFDTMVSLSKEAPIAVFEGDEYLSSPLDRRPKFHLYKPHVALINGIAWDHINVFPTYELYKKQFEIFIDLIESHGVLFYNQTDVETCHVVAGAGRSDITMEAYGEHPYTVKEDVCLLQKGDGETVALQVFGKHNMQNLAGAKKICNQLGIADEDFYKSISTFQGSSKRLQKLFEDEKTTVFLDFAHAPSKVQATLEAVCEQYPAHKVIAVFEMHTFSSLDKGFIGGYKHTLEKAYEAYVYYSPEVVRHKKLPEIGIDEIKGAFSKDNLKIVPHKEQLIEEIEKIDKRGKKVFLYMTSGSFGGLTTNDMVALSRNRDQ